ncbi:MAG: rod-binding protein, partial [bacterium]|nr:rod-binding protein [bacterium]
AAVSSAPSQAKNEAELQEACKQFETLFLTKMLSEMNKHSGGGLIGGGQSEEMFQGMLNEERAKSWAQDGGIGLANILFQQMKDQQL